MAESQLECMEDGRIQAPIPESRAEFYYSEPYRSALQELLQNGDGAFKTHLEKDGVKDFLSAREIKIIRRTLVEYKKDEGDEQKPQAGVSATSSPASPASQGGSSETLRSTYWPQKSDTEVPALDIGWPNSGFFKGVTRVAVHTHPPKDGGPHIKEVVRKLIQEANKLIAIVMDLLTDLQILQDLLDAASKRRVPVYIILDPQGVPHFLDMCNRLKLNAQHLQNVRTRTVKGVGFDMSFGRIPGSLCSRYMIIDGDKVMFGSYSFSWTSSRMDRNMITVMTGQIVDTFDRDFRELYAISNKLNLFKEFHINKPNKGTQGRITVPKRPTLPATSRFQVSLGEAGDLKVPAHKYYNPKYLLALGGFPDTAGSSQENLGKIETDLDISLPGLNPLAPTAESADRLTPQPSITPKGTIKKKFSLFRPKRKGSSKKDKGSFSEEGNPTSIPNTPGGIKEIMEAPEEPAASPVPSAKSKNKKRFGKTKKASIEATDSQDDQGSQGKKSSQNKCRQS